MKAEKELLKRFITPYIWQGYCWIDGGLGTQEAGEGLGWKIVDGKREADPLGVKKAITNPLSRWTSDPSKHRVFLSAESDHYLGDGETADHNGVNPRYVCCFAGPDFSHLQRVIKEISEVCGSQVWTLDSYLPDGTGANQGRYRLWIRQGKIGEQNFEQPCYKILAGTMVPDFSKSTDVAGW